MIRVSPVPPEESMIIVCASSSSLLPLLTRCGDCLCLPLLMPPPPPPAAVFFKPSPCNVQSLASSCPRASTVEFLCWSLLPRSPWPLSPVPASVGSHGPYTPSSHAGPIYADAVAVDINLEADDEPQMTLRPQTGFPFFVFPG